MSSQTQSYYELAAQLRSVRVQVAAEIVALRKVVNDKGYAGHYVNGILVGLDAMERIEERTRIT